MHWKGSSAECTNCCNLLNVLVSSEKDLSALLYCRFTWLKTLVCNLIQKALECYNSILYHLPECSLPPLTKIMHQAARLFWTLIVRPCNIFMYVSTSTCSWHSPCIQHMQIICHPTYLPWLHPVALLKIMHLFNQHLLESILFVIHVLSLASIHSPLLVPPSGTVYLLMFATLL